MAVWTKYDVVGIKEDVSDIISNITPTKTPFQSGLRKEKVHNTLYQWQEDSLAAVAVNAQVEGFTASEASLSPTVMRSNYTQILEKTIKVSATNDAVAQYGRAKETAYQLGKAMAEVKRDKEHAYVGVSNAAAAGTSAVARETASYDQMIATETTEAGAAAALTETMVLNVLEKIYNEGGEADILMIKPGDATIVSGFAAASGRQRDFGHSSKVMNVVDLYVSPYGEVKVVLNRFLLSSHAQAFSFSNWSECVLRPWSRAPLAKTGDNQMHMIVGEFGLKHVNQKASGLIDNIAA